MAGRWYSTTATTATINTITILPFLGSISSIIVIRYCQNGRFQLLRTAFIILQYRHETGPLLNVFCQYGASAALWIGVLSIDAPGFVRSQQPVLLQWRRYCPHCH